MHEQRGNTMVLQHVKTSLSLPAPAWILRPMPSMIRRLCGVIVFAGSALALQAGTRWETLEAIHWVENPTDSARPGPCGELGAYQFRLETWKMHSRRPFSAAV